MGSPQRKLRTTQNDQGPEKSGPFSCVLCELKISLQGKDLREGVATMLYRLFYCELAKGQWNVTSPMNRFFGSFATEREAVAAVDDYHKRFNENLSRDADFGMTQEDREYRERVNAE